MHDKNGHPIFPGDEVKDLKSHQSFHIHDYTTQDHQGAKHVAFSQDVELVKQHPANADKPELPGECIVWGNGPPAIPSV